MKRREVGGRFTKREVRVFEDSDFDEDGRLKEEDEEDDGFADQSFLAHAERLSAWAKAFLRERGFPDCRGVSFPPGRPGEWEACEEMPDSFRLRPRRNWSRLDLYLREYRGVKDDAPADLAARIVCEAYELKRARTNNLAMECAYKLGELAILSHVYSQVSSEHQDLNKKRWSKREEAREKVLRELEKDPHRFHGAVKAGEYYSAWLAREGEGYSFEPDTVEEWIRGFGILKKPAKRLK